MSTRKAAHLPSALSREFWSKAIDAGARLLKPHDGKRLPPEGAAHWVADFADCLLVEFERRFSARRDREPR